MISNQKRIDITGNKPMEKKSKKSKPEKWVKELMDVSASAVVGYEKYLMDKINYTQLARIMTNLRKVLEENGHIFDDDDGGKDKKK